MSSSTPSGLGPHKEDLEVFFWAAREVLKLALLTVATAFCIVALIHGEIPGARELVLLGSWLFSR
jgi:hypothetical protein